jgi:hypothetical protein
MQAVHMQEVLHWTSGMVPPLQVAVHFCALQTSRVLVQACA